jgi:large subunit ribosomal protein L24
MKQKFSTSWISSIQVRKQRKYRYNAPLHLRHKFLSANLSKELRAKYSKRNVPLRKDDEVLVMRGKFSKKKGKILLVNLKTSKVKIVGLTRKKVDGTEINVPFDPSNLQIIDLNLDDKKRLKDIKREEKKIEERKEEVKQELEKKNVSIKSESK